MTNRRREHRNPRQPDLNWYSFGPTGAPDESAVLGEALRKFGQAQAVTFDEELERLSTLILDTAPLPLLSCFSTFFMTSLLRQKKIDDDVEVLQAHGELLQAMVLRYPLDRFVWHEHPSSAIDSIGRCLSSVTRAFSARRSAQLPDEAQIQERARRFVIEFIRGSTQVARNWGYSYQTFAVAEEVLRPLSSDLIRLCGSTATDIVQLWTTITRAVEGRATDIVQRTASVQDETPERLVRRLAREFQFRPAQRDRVLSVLRNSTDDQNDARAIATFLCLELSLPIAHIFTWSHLRTLCPA